MFNNLCSNFFKIEGKDKKNTHAFIGIVLILSTLFGTLTAFAEGLYEVRVVIDGKWYVYNTMEVTVSEFLEDKNIRLFEKDIIDINLDEKINKNMIINIDRAENVIFKIDGKEEVNFITNMPKLGLVLKEFEKEQKAKYYLEDGQSSASVVKDNMVVKISSYKEEINTIEEEVPYKVNIVENNKLPEGVENIKVNGENGIKEIKVKELYLKGNLQSKEIIEEKITKEPITKIIEKGTRSNTIKTEQGVFVINKKINMKSTAYTAGPQCTGKKPGEIGYGVTASGMKARRGVVAVDTSVIPFGTKLYIEGYGHAIAGDTGSAIKGHKIDLFMDSYNEAIQHGVRNVDVYVLGEKIY